MIAFELEGIIRLRTTQFNRDLSKVKSNLNTTMATFQKNITQLNRGFNKITKPILSLAKTYMTAVTGFAAKALQALYNSNTKAGKQWKGQFDLFKAQMSNELARLGAMLLQTPIFGKKIPEWMDKFIELLRSIDLSKLQQMVSLFEKAAIAVVAIKSISTVLSMMAGLAGIAKLIPAGAKAAVGGAISKGAGAVGGAASGGLAGLATKIPALLAIIALVSTIFYGLKDAVEGVKIVFAAIVAELEPILTPLKALANGLATIGGWILKSGAFIVATMNGIGAFLGTLFTKANWGDGIKKGFENAAKAADEAMQESLKKNLINKEMKKYTAEAETKPENMNVTPKPTNYTGRYVGLTEGVKLAQEMAAQDRQLNLMRRIADNTGVIANAASPSGSYGVAGGAH